MPENIRKFYAIATALAAIGAVNWGLVGVFDFDLVAAAVFSDNDYDASVAARFIYALVGVAGLLSVGSAFLLWGSRDVTGAVQ